MAARIPRGALALALLGSACVAPRSGEERVPDSASVIPKLAVGESGYAIFCGRVLTMDGEDRAYDPGLIVVREERLVYVGAPRAVPAGYEQLDLRDGWAIPGMVDLHSHVHAGGGFGDLNDMVLPLNADFRAGCTLVTSNPNVRRATAAGVTTLYGIPGSGTSIGGFGVLYKTKTAATYGEAVIADPGGMKVAQTHNPQRGAGDFGASWAALGWMLADLNDKAIAAREQGREDWQLENLGKVHAGELPVLIHCAGSDGVADAVRMWKGEYDTRCVVSHACFDAYRIAPYIVEMDVPINHGPRTIDYRNTRDSRFVGTAAVYLEAGAENFSLNTDSPVVPQEELFLQGSMSAHYGADAYQMLRALTIHPATVFGLGERLGSLEHGKDADLCIFSGDPLDPRSRAELVMIDGRIEYDCRRDGQWF